MAFMLQCLCHLHTRTILIVQLLEVDKTSLLAISTPSPEGGINFCECPLPLYYLLLLSSLTLYNWLLLTADTNMMNMRDPNTNEPMFKCLKVGLACEA